MNFKRQKQKIETIFGGQKLKKIKKARGTPCLFFSNFSKEKKRFLRFVRLKFIERYLKKK